MKTRSLAPVATLAALSCVSCGDLPPDPPADLLLPQAASVELDPRRSFAITDKDILAPFTFKRVMDQLAQQSGVPGLTALTLFRQWWDTQNPGPGLGLGPHCDDQQVGGSPRLNGYPYACRPLEGAQAATDPFATPETNPDAYVPIGLFNRFDLASKNGISCGEYRIVFAKRSGIADEFQRNLIIFEGAMLNPERGSKLAGCKKVAEFWANLSKEDKLEKRSKALEKFYFDGFNPQFPPAVHISAYGDNDQSFGQIRVNSFVNPAGATKAAVPWSLREFKLLRSGCGNAGAGCAAMKMVPVTVKSNAFGGLWNALSRDPAAISYDARAIAFQDALATTIPSLLINDPTEITMNVEEPYNAAQSFASSSPEDRYDLQMGTGASPARASIAAKLAELGSPLTVDHVIRRAMTVSCAGCHRHNDAAPNNDLGDGLMWQPSLGFTHVSERLTEADVPTRFRISDALKNVFLPKRMAVMDTYLRTGKGRENETDFESNDPIKGGGRHD